MLSLAIRMAGHRLTALLAVAFAVFGGAALVTGTGVLAETGLRSHLPAGRLAGADLVVSADQAYHPPADLPLALPERATVPADLLARLARIPGVQAAVGDLSFPAAVVGPDGRPLSAGDPSLAGHGWSSTGLLASPQVEGRAPSGPGEIALDRTVAAAAQVRLGDRVQVVAAGRPGTYRLVAVVSPGAGILFTDPRAAELAGRENRSQNVDLIGLQVREGVTESVTATVRHELRGRGLIVAAGNGRGDSTAPGALAARSLLVLLAGSLAGIILLIIGFVVAGALAVAIGGQRRDLALLRAVGATPRQIRRLAAAQAGIVAIVALGPGVALGYLLAGRFRSMLVTLGLLPDQLPLTISPLPAVAACLLLLLVVQVSAFTAAWRTSRLPATEAVAESRAEPRTPSRIRFLAGLVVIAVAGVLALSPLLSRSVLGAAGTSLAGIVSAIGLALAGPTLLSRAGVALARRLPPNPPAATWLAVANLRGYALRLAGVVGALAMAVVFVLTYTLAQTTLMSAASGEVRSGTLAQHRLTAPGLGGLPIDTLAEVRAVSGVQAAVPLTSTTVLWPYRMLGDDEIESTPAMILPPAAGEVLDLDVRAGDLAGLTGATVAVGSDLARSRDAGVGRQVTLILGDGARVSARVVATYDRNLGFGSVVLSKDLAAGHTSTGLDASVLIRTAPGPDAERALAAFVASRPGLSLTGTVAEPGGLSTVSAETWINLATIAVLLGYLLLSIANKLVATTAQRRTEIAALRLIGTTPRQILAMMRREAALISVAALAAGLALSAAPLALVGLGFLDRPWPAGPIWLLPATACTVTAIAFLTIELPTRQALRTAPADALARQG